MIGRWDWFMGTCDTRWIGVMHAMGARNTSLIGAMGLIYGGVRHWLERGDGIDSWGLAMGACDSGWIGAMGLIYGAVQHWLEGGDGIDSWGLAMGARDTGWIGVMVLIYGGVPWGRATRAGSGWLDRFMGMPHGVGDWIGVMGLIGGVAPWGRATLARSGTWHWFMGAHNIGWIGAMGLIHGAHHGPCDTGWIGVMGLIHRGAPWGRVTLAGSGRWVWLMGAHDTVWPGAMGSIDGGARHGLERGDGIDLWGRVMEAHDWIGEMGLICGGTPWVCDTGWMWAMGLSYGGVLWGHRNGSGDGIDLWERTTTLTRSGRWDWFMWARNGGARHWLDRGDEIDSWGHCQMTSTIWLLNLNDDTMCPHVWRWGKCAECVWLRGW